MGLRDKVRAHWQQQVNGSLIEVKVPEWEEVLYFRRGLSLRERASIQKAEHDDGLEAVAREILFLLARDEDGQRAFTSKEDAKVLWEQADPDVVRRVANEAFDQVMTPTQREAEGNSEAVPS